MIYDIRYGALCQDPPQLAEALSDKGRNGKERPWKAYKVANEYLAMAYDDFDTHKADRLRLCCKTIEADVKKGTGELVRIVGFSSCRVRLCPLCAWRRSLKNFWTTTKIVRWLDSHQDDKNVGRFSYIFVTLTVRNCKGSELSSQIDALFAAVKRLYQRAEVSSVWKGAVRNLEITHNVDPSSKDYDTFHPHFHMIVAVRPSYFSHGYISQKRLVELWRDALGVDYDPVCDIRRVKSLRGQDTAGAIAECSKYAAKAADYIILDDWDLTCGTVRLLDAALDRRRLITYSGVFREVKALLKLEDCEEGDLVRFGEELPTVDESELERVIYWWYSGYRQYYKVAY